MSLHPPRTWGATSKQQEGFCNQGVLGSDFVSAFWSVHFKVIHPWDREWPGAHIKYQIQWKGRLSSPSQGDAQTLYSAMWPDHLHQWTRQMDARNFFGGDAYSGLLTTKKELVSQNPKTRTRKPTFHQEGWSWEGPIGVWIKSWSCHPDDAEQLLAISHKSSGKLV